MTNAEARFNKSHIRKVYACLAVTCHLHLWQNDRDSLRATAVTRGWNGYRNKGQHRKSTLEKKFLPPLKQGFDCLSACCFEKEYLMKFCVLGSCFKTPVLSFVSGLFFFLSEQYLTKILFTFGFSTFA